MPPSDVLAVPPEAPERESWLGEYRDERLRKLERENEYLRADRDRTEHVLALALQVAVGKTDVSPLVLLELLYAVLGFNSARPAWVENRERRRREAQSEMVMRVLRETAP